jgi:hypothetical protein
MRASLGLGGSYNVGLQEHQLFIGDYLEGKLPLRDGLQIVC